MNLKIIIVLLLSNILYASESIFSKYASMADPLSIQYLLGIMAVVMVLGVYAILWQQILKRVDLSYAYMFKGTSLIFVLLFSTLLFDENLTINNIIGTIVLITGISLYAKS